MPKPDANAGDRSAPATMLERTRSFRTHFRGTRLEPSNLEDLRHEQVPEPIKSGWAAAFFPAHSAQEQ